MGLITIEQARAHCRADADVPDAQLQPYIDGAESAACAYLNRAVFGTQGDLDAALDALPAKAATAAQAYADAVEAAASIVDADQRRVTLEVASLRKSISSADATRVMNGIVAAPSVVSAILLTLGSLYSNREAVIVGLQVAELPLGACELLRPYRLVMMP